MRILHASLFFSVKHAGGTVDLIYKLARAQSARGHDVCVYTGDFRLDAAYAASLRGARVRAFRSWLNFGFYLMPGLVLAARKELRRFDIIHLHCYRSFQNVVLHYFAKRRGIPFVMDSHGSLPKFVRKRRLKALFDLLVGRRILRDAARCIGETELGVNEYLEAGVAKDKVVLIPPPFPVEDFRTLPQPGQFRARFGIGDRRLVMFLGRIHWIKGLDFLVEGFADLAKPRDDVLLAVVGPDDGYRTALEQIIEREGLAAKVRFTGFLGGEDKLAALVDADVVVQTSRYEQGAWAPFEAVLCGTPIVVSRNSGAGEDVKRIDAGYLVDFGDRAELRDTLAYVLDHPDEARQKARTAKAYIEANLSMANRIRDYEVLYEECVAERRRDGRRGWRS
ncbi:MAG: hypothetical protein DMD91_31280 [Candidatus Rokuibacteriota bacterium]|nr:MAG: hypothetical protein DMD91_31280 [Candidatus Rokubacteria bacterium]